MPPSSGVEVESCRLTQTGQPCAMHGTRVVLGCGFAREEDARPTLPIGNRLGESVVLRGADGRETKLKERGVRGGILMQTMSKQ